MARSTEQVFQHYGEALAEGLSKGDFSAVMADFADDAVRLTMEGAYVGKAAIQDAAVKFASAMPHAKLSVTGRFVHGDYLMVTWKGDSDVATIPYGVDTMVIHDDKIRLQTSWWATVPK